MAVKLSGSGARLGSREGPNNRGGSGAVGFQGEVEEVGHSQVLVLGDPAETMVLQDDNWGHVRLGYQFLIIHLCGQGRAGEGFKGSPFLLSFQLPTPNPKPHHNKYCIREEFSNPPSNFQGQGPRAV